MPAWIPIATSIAGSTLNKLGSEEAAEQQQKYNLDLMRAQNEYNKQAVRNSIEGQKELFEATGYGARVRQLKEAGLNPGLIYGMGNGGGGITGSVAALGVGSGSAPNTLQAHNNNQLYALSLSKIASEIEVNKSVAEANRANAGLNTQKTSTEEWNTVTANAEAAIKGYEKRMADLTMEQKLQMVDEELNKLILSNKQARLTLTLTDEQIKAVHQKIAQEAYKFPYDIVQQKKEIEKIIKETTNMNLTASEDKWMDVISRLLGLIRIK